MKKEELKFCVDCKFCIPRNNSHSILDCIDYYCNYSAIIHYDLVTGKEFKSGIKSCSNERSDQSSCGPTGKNYSPKY